MSNTARFLMFLIGIWLLVTLPYFLEGDKLGALKLGTANAVVVVSLLFLWSLLRTRFTLPSAGLCLSAAYLVLASVLMFFSYAVEAKEPEIWMGTGLLLTYLCPPAILPFYLLPPALYPPLPYDMLLAVVVGVVYYFLVGELFAKWSLIRKPRTQSPEQT